MLERKDRTQHALFIPGSLVDYIPTSEMGSVHHSLSSHLTFLLKWSHPAAYPECASCGASNVPFTAPRGAL